MPMFMAHRFNDACLGVQGFCLGFLWFFGVLFGGF